MSDQASTIVLENEEPAQVPSEQETQYDEKTFVKQLLDACSNNKEKYNFEDYVVETGRGLEDVHPKTRQKCYINREEALQGFVGKIRYRGKRTATHNLMVFESMMRGPHALFLIENRENISMNWVTHGFQFDSLFFLSGDKMI